MGIKHALIALGAAIILAWPCSTRANPLVPEIEYEGSDTGIDDTKEYRRYGEDADPVSVLYSLDDVDPNAGLRAFVYDGKQDNVAEVPEPATISLLGLSSLALIRKRR